MVEILALQSEPSLASILRRTILEFISEDIPAEVATFVAGVGRMFKLALSSRYLLRQETWAGARNQIKAKLLGTTLRRATQNLVNASSFLRRQIIDDTSGLNPLERSKYFCRLGSYTAAWTGSVYLGNALPDQDLSALGIGAHRNFAFHSVVSAMCMRLVIRLVQRMILALEEGGLILASSEVEMIKRCLVLARNGATVGVATHLCVDGSFQGTKAVLWGPDIGSLINGTLFDDNAWLLFNGFVSAALGRESGPVAIKRQTTSTCEGAFRANLLPVFC